MTWLLIFLLNHSPQHALNHWACDLVNSQPGDGGCYDWCYTRAAYLELDYTSQFIHDPAKVNFYQVKDARMPLYLPHTYSDKLINACAVVLSGSEF